MIDTKNLKSELLKKTNEIKQGLEAYKNNKNMGLGELGDPTTVFVRKFRWTLKGTRISEHFFKRVEFDFKHQQLVIACMEVVASDSTDIEIQKWLESNLETEVLTFTTYDGCGVPLYEFKISGLKVLADNCDFDYATSDVSERKALLQYNKLERTFLAKGDPRLPKKKHYTWTAQAAGDLRSVDVKVTNRPTLDIEETEINFLSAKMWVPGKQKWEEMTLTMDRRALKVFTEGVLNQETPEVVLSLHLCDKVRVLETWTLKNVSIEKSVLNDEKKYEVTLKYDEVKYQSLGGDDEQRNQGKDQPELKTGSCQPARPVL